MKHTIIATAAAVALLSGSAFAGDYDKNKNNPEAEKNLPLNHTTMQHKSTQQNEIQLMKASDMIGSSVKNPQGEEIGEIEDLIVTSDNVARVIIDVGGFLGMGEKTVAVSYSELNRTADGEALYLNRTKDQLRALPAWEWKETDQLSNVKVNR